MNHIIKKNIRNHLTVEVISNSSLKDNLLKWGTTYISRGNKDITYDLSRFIFYFKEAAVSVKSYDILTGNTNVFPTNWTISVSHDSITWKIIDRKDESLCSSQYIEKPLDDYKYYCNTSELKHFVVDNPTSEYYQYVMFHQIKNSYYGAGNWYDQLYLNGFELNGDFFMSYRKIPTRHCSHRNHNHILLYCILITAS